MDKTKVNLYSWNRFISRNLVILPELLGKELEFSFEDYTIKIKLPGIKDVDRGKEFDSIITVGARRASDNEPLEYDVIKVDVKVIKPLSTMVPSEALKRNANAYELFSQKEQERLNKVVEIHKAIAERAFEYWMRILRWKCDDSRLGRPEIHDYQSGWSTYLYDLDSGKKLWIEPGIFHVRGYGKVDSQKWIETVEAIQSGLEPPIYIEFKHAAERNLEYGDLNRAVVDLAISCETYLRSVVLGNLPRGSEQSIFTYIEESNISQYINKFFPNILEEEQKKEFRKISSSLHKLFKQRNQIMHSGTTDELTLDACKKHLQVTSKLLAIQVR